MTNDSLKQLRLSSHFFTLCLAACLWLLAGTAETRAQNAITVSENGVGGITKDTPFNLKRIQALFPGLKVKQITQMSEGVDYRAFEVRDQAGVLMTISENEGKVGSVTISSSRVNTGLSAKIGSVYSQVYASRRTKCEPGFEEETGTVYCEAPNSRSISYQFKGRGVSDGEIPPMKTLRRLKLIAIIWSVPGE